MMYVSYLRTGGGEEHVGVSRSITGAERRMQRMGSLVSYTLPRFLSSLAIANLKDGGKVVLETGHETNVFVIVPADLND